MTLCYHSGLLLVLIAGTHRTATNRRRGVFTVFTVYTVLYTVLYTVKKPYSYTDYSPQNLPNHSRVQQASLVARKSILFKETVYGAFYLVNKIFTKTKYELSTGCNPSWIIQASI